MLMRYLITYVLKRIWKKLGLRVNCLRKQVKWALAQQVISCEEFDLSNAIYSDAQLSQASSALVDIAPGQ